MPSSFPFQVAVLPPPTAPERQLAIFADVGGLEEYYVLFRNYGFGGTAESWVEHLQTIIEEHQPELLEELAFEEGGHTFVAYAPNQAVADRFLACVLPFFGTLPRLQNYLSQADPEDFFA
ncbi:hypothetical protein IC235_13980 [Hymenobacter sp. BT664]|uniref:Immunity protein 51 of polymorphic toxin system n=1 Tax=Hymenobacter montanus TaxID=2771359 RepID=A0A927BDU9_9BACT|nr:hypothetical protein [Hymenobacter montanus]MBD2768997.1 hypothetical protein [Hymenobacter montanus]